MNFPITISAIPIWFMFCWERLFGLLPRTRVAIKISKCNIRASGQLAMRLLYFIELKDKR